MLKRPDSKSLPALLRHFYPNFIADSVATIDFEYLYKNGVKAGLIDLDGTVVSRGTYDVDQKLVNVLKDQPLKLYIATNRPKSRSLQNLQEALNTNGVIHPVGLWGKPFPKYFAQAASEHGLNPSELVMIGDRYIQDIFGANLAGVKTVVVKKLDRPTNLIDRILSGIERRRTEKLAAQYNSVG